MEPLHYLTDAVERRCRPSKLLCICNAVTRVWHMHPLFKSNKYKFGGIQIIKNLKTGKTETKRKLKRSPSPVASVERQLQLEMMCLLLGTDGSSKNIPNNHVAWQKEFFKRAFLLTRATFSSQSGFSADRQTDRLRGSTEFLELKAKAY